jgi:hypothetical protein
MTYCNDCLAIVSETTAKRELERRQNEDLKPFSIETATGCELCKLILINLLPEGGPAIWEDHPLSLQGLLYNDVTVGDQILYSEMSVGDGDFGTWGNVHFAVWANEGTASALSKRSKSDHLADSPASEMFITRPPISRNWSKDVSDLTRYWLDQCCLKHVSCSGTEEIQLPTRLLQISGTVEAPLVKLMETGGMKGRYCALSHMWGPVDKQPLRTTRANLSDRTAAIPFEQLPLTFRDTVMLARGIGIEYVWIDSLCIVQDDTQDWQSEAKKMGSVYSNATLVIAAASAHDSTEGLFKARQTSLASLRVPYMCDGIPKGSYNVSLLPERQRPASSPLRERAWVFQEWYLGQRILFFMPNEVMWRCNTCELTGRGGHHDLGLYERKSWLDLLREYSSKKLTYATDRLYALEGVAGRTGKARDDQYLSQYGVWDDHLVEQLLWRINKSNTEEDRIDLPTWSWAAIAGQKVWCPFDNKHAFRHMPKACKITNSGSLRITGHMYLPSLAFRVISPESFNLFSNYSLEYNMLPTDNLDDYPLYAISDNGNEEMILGIAVLDGNPSVQAKSWFLASSERSPAELLYVCYGLQWYHKFDRDLGIVILETLIPMMIL